nr:DUF2306 domain-containing protein [Amycolatopsis anabasis]
MNSRTGTGHRPVGGRQPWWQRPWVVPLAFLAAVFLVYSLPPYLGLDPASSRVPAPPGVGWYYPALVAHIGFASVAMVTCVLQVWPWFRQRHPVAHRRIGRVYVFAGVLPAGVMGLAIALAGPFGPVAATSNALLAVLWLIFTIAGFRMARARRFGEHRKWMIRSFALTMSIISNRIWAVVWALALEPQLATTFGGSEQALGQAIAGLTTWTGWVFPLLIAQWWLERGRGRKTANRSQSVAAR